MKRLALAITFLIAGMATALAQANVQVIGPITPGNVPQFSSPTIIKDSGVPGGTGAFANPTATAGPTAINGSANTAMRSDAAPAVQKGTNLQFGIVEGDGTTIDCSVTPGICIAKINGILPTPTRAGDIIYWNGFTWVTLPGNNSGTNCLQETSSGVPTFASCSGSTPIQGTPQGRLTLSSGVPVMTTDFAGATTIYYAPYVGQYVPIYNGVVQQLSQFTSSTTDTVGLSIALGTSWAANTIYDVFVGLNSSTVTMCTGPAWTNSGAGTSTRGSNAGTTQLALFNGLWTNAVSMTCRFNNTTTFSCAVNQCTYVGSFITNGSTGTIDFKGPSGSVGAGGVLDCICVWNAYNQVRGRSFNGDSTASWTYTTATFRQANASASNQVNMLQGLTGNSIYALNSCLPSNTTANLSLVCGIGIDSTSSNSATLSFTQSIVNTVVTSTGLYTGSLGVGFHNIVRLEYSQVAGTTTWFGSNAPPAQSGMNVEFFW
jgi:hypothetical protein